MVNRKKYDVAIIGSGPGGYVAAIKAAQLGKSVALIEKNLLGGTCLNVGCIPTKTLLSSSATLHQIKRAADFGIETGPVSFSYAKMLERKARVVNGLRAGLETLLQANRVTLHRGHAAFEGPHELKISGEEGLFLSAEAIIIATGSQPLEVKAFPCDHQRILNSTSILDLATLPKSLAIIGGGYIGCEFASFFAELGVKVTLLEALPTLLATQGKTVAEFMMRAFKEQGIDIQTNVRVQKIEKKPSCLNIVLEGQNTVTVDAALVAVGRQVYTEGLRLERAGLGVTAKGAIATNEKMATEVSGIYAIGDVTGKGMLAHVASHQGIVAAINACGLDATMHYDTVPAVVFTAPEIATVGLTFEQAVAAGYQVATGRMPFQALGKAQAALDTEGFTQVIADKKTGQILGAVAIGHEASNLIAEMALAMHNELTLECLQETIHAHPTLAEGWHEAVAIALGMPIHLPPKGKRE